MQTVLLIVHLLTSLALIALVLIQQGKGAEAGAAFGAGASATVFGSQGSASFLTRATAALATVFFITSLSLAYLSGKHMHQRSVTEMGGTPASSAPAAPVKKQTPPAPAKVQKGDLPPAPASEPAPADKSAVPAAKAPRGTALPPMPKTGGETTPKK